MKKVAVITLLISFLLSLFSVFGVSKTVSANHIPIPTYTNYQSFFERFVLYAVEHGYEDNDTARTYVVRQMDVLKTCSGIGPFSDGDISQECINKFFTTGIEQGGATYKFEPKTIGTSDVLTKPDWTTACQSGRNTNISLDSKDPLWGEPDRSKLINEVMLSLCGTGLSYEQARELATTLATLGTREKRLQYYGAILTTINENRRTGGGQDDVVNQVNKRQYTAVQNENQYRTEQDAECGRSSIGGCVVQGIAWLGTRLIQLFGFLLALSGWLFEAALKLSIQDMHELARMDSIAIGWSVARDFANLFFIFILLYIAIGTILDLGGINTGKQVGMVILVALLINFSLVLTKVVIDVGNAPALFFYQAVMRAGNENEGLSVRIVNSLRIQQITGLTDLTSGNVGGAEQLANRKVGFGTSFVGVIAGTFGGIIVILVASFVLIATAAMFLGRALMLIFLMILSPLAFLGLAFNQMKDLWSWWKGQLYNQVFFAPAYMAIFAIAMVLITVGGAQGGLLFNRVGQATSAPYAIAGLILYYFLVVYALTYTLAIAKRFGAWGATYWDGKYKEYSKSVRGWAGRNTYGWGAANLANTRAVRFLAANKLTSRIAGKPLLKSLDAIGKDYVKQTKESAEEHNKFQGRLKDNLITGGDFTRTQHDESGNIIYKKDKVGNFILDNRGNKIAATETIDQYSKTYERNLGTFLNNRIIGRAGADRAGVEGQKKKDQGAKRKAALESLEKQIDRTRPYAEANEGDPNYITNPVERLKMQNEYAQLLERHENMKASDDLRKAVEKSGGGDKKPDGDKK